MMNAANPAARVPPRIEPAFNVGSLLNLMIIAALVGALAVLFWFNPAQFGFYPRCAFYEATGLQCPGCGSLRACHQLLHGHVGAAFQLNPLFVVSLPFFGWLGLRIIVDTLQHRPSSVGLRPFWLWTGLAVLLLFGVGRNLPVHWLGWLH